MNTAARPPLLADAKLFELSPHHVDAGERIGFLHEDKAAALGRLMAVDGQRDPIKVVAQAGNPDLPWRLVTGMHRLIGARIEGLTVWAIEVHGKPEELADLEASENLHRRPLAPIERAKFVAALCEAARMRVARETGGVRQQQAAIRARWAKVKNAETSAEAALQEEVEDTTRHLVASYGWQESAADAFGLGIRDLQRALQLHRLIVEPFPDLIAGLAAHPVVGENGAQLKAVAGIRDEALRRKVIERLLADPELSADEARVQEGIDSPRGPAPSKELRLTSTISDSWSRLPLAARRDYLPRFVTLLTPDLKRRTRELIDADLGAPAPAPAAAPDDQAKKLAASTIAVLNRLIEGEGVDDDELMRLRFAAQGVVFGLPEKEQADV